MFGNVLAWLASAPQCYKMSPGAPPHYINHTTCFLCFKDCWRRRGALVICPLLNANAVCTYFVRFLYPMTFRSYGTHFEYAFTCSLDIWVTHLTFGILLHDLNEICEVRLRPNPAVCSGTLRRQLNWYVMTTIVVVLARHRLFLSRQIANAVCSAFRSLCRIAMLCISTRISCLSIRCCAVMQVVGGHSMNWSRGSEQQV